MAVGAAERTALFVIRAWIETKGERVFRARITRTLDLDQRNETSTIVASRAEIDNAIKEWLDAFLRDGTLTEP